MGVMSFSVLQRPYIQYQEQKKAHAAPIYRNVASKKQENSTVPVKLCGGIMALLSSLANLVNLLVHLSPVVVTILASTGNSVGNPSRMPGTNTGNLAETPVGLAGKAGDTPTSDHTLITLTLGNTNDVNHLILLEHSVNRNLLLEELVAIVHLVSNGTAIDLNLHEVSLLLLQTLHLPNLKCRNEHEYASL